MKFDLIIKDATQEEVLQFLSKTKLAVNDSPLAELLVNVPGGTPCAPSDAVTKGYVASNIIGSNPVAVISESDTDEVSNVDVTGAVDSEGLLWNEQIHSSNKKMTAKGVWQRRRGLSELEYARIKGNLLGNTANTPQSQHVIYVGGMSNTSPLPIPFNPPVATATLTTSAQAVHTISDLLVRMQQAFGAGKITQEYFVSLVGRVNNQLGANYTTVTDFTNNQNAINLAYNFMNSDGN